MYKDGAASIQAILDELVAGREVFEQVLVIHVVHLDDLVTEALKQLLLQRKSQYRQYMRDATSLERVSAA